MKLQRNCSTIFWRSSSFDQDSVSEIAQYDGCSVPELTFIFLFVEHESSMLHDKFQDRRTVFLCRSRFLIFFTIYEHRGNPCHLTKIIL